MGTKCCKKDADKTGELEREKPKVVIKPKKKKRKKKVVKK